MFLLKYCRMCLVAYLAFHLGIYSANANWEEKSLHQLKSDLTEFAVSQKKVGEDFKKIAVEWYEWLLTKIETSETQYEKQLYKDYTLLIRRVSLELGRFNNYQYELNLFLASIIVEEWSIYRSKGNRLVLLSDLIKVCAIESRCRLGINQSKANYNNSTDWGWFMINDVNVPAGINGSELLPRQSLKIAIKVLHSAKRQGDISFYNTRSYKRFRWLDKFKGVRLKYMKYNI